MSHTEPAPSWAQQKQDGGSPRRVPRSALLLIPLTAVLLWWALDASQTLPTPDEALIITEADVVAGDAITRLRSLPHDWRNDLMDVAARYRFDVQLQVPPNRLWGVLLPAVEQNARVYLNDEVVGSSASSEAHPARAASRPLYFVLPNGLLRPGNNTFEIAVRTYPPGQGFLGPIYIGPDEALSAVFARRHFLQVQLLWMFVAGSLGMALVIAVLAWQRPRETVYRWLAAVSATWAMLTALTLMADVPLPNYWVSAMISAAATAFCASAFMFALRFVGLAKPRLARLICGAAVIGVLAVLGAALLAPHLVYRIGPLSTAVQMLIGPFVIVHLVRNYLHSRDPELFLLLYVGGLVMIFGAINWSTSAGVVSAVGSRYLFYATPLIVAVLVTLLVRRFVSALDRSERLAETLEARVAQKSDELARNYRRLGDLERESALARERERIMRDMHDGVGGHIVSSLSRYRSLGIEDAYLGEALQRALTDLRLMIDSLETVDGDLNVALGMLRSRLQGQFDVAGLTIRWEVPELPRVDHLSPEAVLQVLRILQEAITNVIKHAAARTVTLKARTDSSSIRISVIDDGIGIDPTLCAGTADAAGHGLRNMMRRAESLGAQLEVTRQSHGTRVELTISHTLTVDP